jgi:hypothetical protein
VIRTISRVAAASSTMSCSSWHVDHSGDQVRSSAAMNLGFSHLGFLRYHSNRHLCQKQRCCTHGKREQRLHRRIAIEICRRDWRRAQGHYELCVVFSIRSLFRFKRAGGQSKQMRGAKNPNALTDSNPCPKGPTGRNKRCGKKQKQTGAPLGLSPALSCCCLVN